MRFIGKDPNITDAYYTATASGALASGDTVIANSDGTISAVTLIPGGSPQVIGSPQVFESAQVDIRNHAIAYDSNAQKVVIGYLDEAGVALGTAIVGTVSGTSITFGSAAVFENASTAHVKIAYDSNAQKVVIAYRDNANSGYGTAVVGTVSGTSISFGTVVVFESASTYNPAIAYDENAQKVVIAYTDISNNSYGTAIVGTVSGTSISFGTAVVFESVDVGTPDIVYDSTSQKVVIAYNDSTNSEGNVIVGTVSGTSISFGSETTFSTGGTVSSPGTAYDSNAQKVVIAYRDGGNSGRGTAVVGTVSGTSISVGSEVVFNDSNTNDVAIAYDPNVKKVVITYGDVGNSSYGTAIVGTVSGTSISFGTEVVFESASTTQTSIAYDENAKKFVIAYRDGGNSLHGTAVLFEAGQLSTSLTSENYIGIADQAYTDGQDATVAVAGCIDRNQTGLTAGQQYFIQNDGTIGTTADNPSVLAGTAISATELVVKE